MIDEPREPRQPYYGQAPYWTQYWSDMRVQAAEIYEFNLGLEYCEWDSDWVNLMERKDNIIRKFNARYRFREVGQETPQRMQHYLQIMLDKVAPKVELMARMLAEGQLERFAIGYKETIDFKEKGTNKANINSTGSSDSRFEDTPLDAEEPDINNPTTRTKDRTSDEQHADGETDIERKTVHDKQLYDRLPIEYAQIVFREWEDLDDLFIGMFEPLFIQCPGKMAIENIYVGE